MDKKEKRKKILKVSGLIGLFLLAFGLSYALFTVTLNGTKKVKLKTGKLELQLLDENDNPIYITNQNNTTSYEINLDNQVPISDEDGLSTQGFTFKLDNTGSIDARYTIYLDDVALDIGEERIADQYVKYSLTKNNSEGTPALLSTTLAENERELDKGVIREDETNTYTLKIWIDEEATNEAMDKVFNATLRVEGVQYVAPPAPNYGTKIAEAQITETITATYYQPDTTGYNGNSIKRMSNVKKIDNEIIYEGGTLVISGTGAIPDADEETWISPIHLFLANDPTLEDLDELYDEEWEACKFKYNPANLVIEDGITSIGKFSFARLLVENVVLPNTLEYIKNCSFAEVEGITKLVLSGHNLVVDDGALTGIRTLKEVYFTNTVQSIGDYLLENIENVETIYIAGTPEILGDDPFYCNVNIIYCETQQTADTISSKHIGNAQVVVDPSKFE